MGQCLRIASANKCQRVTVCVDGAKSRDVHERRTERRAPQPLAADLAVEDCCSLAANGLFYMAAAVSAALIATAALCSYKHNAYSYKDNP